MNFGSQIQANESESHDPGLGDVESAGNAVEKLESEVEGGSGVVQILYKFRKSGEPNAKPAFINFHV